MWLETKLVFCLKDPKKYGPRRHKHIGGDDSDEVKEKEIWPLALGVWYRYGKLTLVVTLSHSRVVDFLSFCYNPCCWK